MQPAHQKRKGRPLLLAAIFATCAIVTTHPAAGQSLEITEFSRDRTVFDSGAQLGNNAATIPLSGTSSAPDDTEVEARVVAEDGGEMVPWTPCAKIADGKWSGRLDGVARNPAWMRVEARLQGKPDSTVRMKHRLGVGHVWALYEQSNWARLFNPRFSKTPTDPVTDPEAVQIFTIDRKSHEVTRIFINDETPLSSAAVAFANAFVAERPGEKLALAAHVASGTSPIDMIDPDGPGGKRAWTDEVTLHEAITKDGSPVGLVTVNGWIAFSGGRPSNDDVLVPIITAKLVDGTPLNLGDEVKAGGESFLLKHSLSELYDWHYSRFTMVGPHGRDGDGGYTQPADLDYQKMVDDWRAILSDPKFPEFLPHAFETQGALRGVPAGKGGWTDAAHHSATDKDGLERLARLGMEATLFSAKLVSWPRPAFDRVYWDPSGQHVDFWMNGFNITTERLRRGLPPIPSTFPHRTEVLGFSIDGEPAHDAHIVASAGNSGFAGVRVKPISGKFTAASDVQYGLGTLAGFVQDPEDFQDAYYLNLPVVDVGQKGLPALPLSPRSTNDLPRFKP